MKKIKTNTFDLVMEKVSHYTGYTVVELKSDDGMVNIYHYDTKEEFDQDFVVKKHPYYPDDQILPKNVIKGGRSWANCILNGEESYMELLNVYLLIDGTLK